VTHYDLAVIGTGSGNTVVTKQLKDWKVAILEHGVFGGTCSNVGCIPTKMFVYPSDLARGAQHAQELGVNTRIDGVRWQEIRDRIFVDRIDPLSANGAAYRERLPNIDLYRGHATFLDDHTLDTGTGARITADQIVIAAGSRVDVADVPGLDEVEFHTSDTVMRLPELPRRMTIVGGGFVAAEFAHIFSAYGTEVTQVHRGSSLLRTEDEDVSRLFTELAGRQWNLRLGTTLTKVARHNGAITLVHSDGSEHETDVLLMATGRVSNADRLGLENTSIEVHEDGRVVADDHQRTTAPGVWTLGDVSSAWWLKHVANHEADVVRHNVQHPDELRSSDHRFVPSAVFTSPQIASVGLTGQAAREQGIEHRSVTHDYASVAYGWAMESTPGEQFVKLLATPDGEHLLGAHIIGPQASLLLQPLVQAISLGTPIARMARNQYWIHPSMAEVVENALLKLVD
jgi:mycothione reductase